VQTTNNAPRHAAKRSRIAYLARIARVYANKSSGPLSFWYERPTMNEAAFVDGGLEYFMQFQGKANYRGPFDADGVPILDYQGDIGPQHNPIAIAQYGLARFNRWLTTGAAEDSAAWMAVAQWLVRELKPNDHGVPVWMHHFDWPYRQVLKAPWYSGLAQGNGLSMLVRAARSTSDAQFADAAHAAFESFTRDVSAGGVMATDEQGDLWIEEYLVDPPSHILNGFIWALWGVYDYAQWSGSPQALKIWECCLNTLERRLHEFDTGWWSLYEARNQGEEMPASRYYHTLHITQLQVLHRQTGRQVFADAAARWQGYLHNGGYRLRALAQKAIFKLRRY
jgi:heparosan-N-sulfate-glucuronate 5-epimerase